MPTTPRVYTSVEFSEDFILKVIRTWVILYNDPTFSALWLRVYSNNGGYPGKLLHTSSNYWTRDQVSAQDNAARELYFEFDNTPVFKAGDLYHIAPWLDDYIGTDDSHVAWRKDFPDPCYRQGLTINMNQLGKFPYAVRFIGAEFK
jgi:hypothetical protein